MSNWYDKSNEILKYGYKLTDEEKKELNKKTKAAIEHNLTLLYNLIHYVDWKLIRDDDWGKITIILTMDDGDNVEYVIRNKNYYERVIVHEKKNRDGDWIPEPKMLVNKKKLNKLFTALKEKDLSWLYKELEKAMYPKTRSVFEKLVQGDPEPYIEKYGEGPPEIWYKLKDYM